MSRLIPDNPVLTKELRVRMRGARAYWILFGYLGFLSCVLLGGYYAWQSNVHSQGAGSSEVAEFGAQIFDALIITQVFLVLFITPAITSGSLSIEKEQRTLDMLTMTRMPRRGIIIGKLLAAVLFTSLLLISSLPLISICFMLGSIDPSMVTSVYIELLFGSFLIGAMGLMWSSIAKNTTQAVLFTYASLMALFIVGAFSLTISRAPFGAATGSETAFRAIAEPLFGPTFLGIPALDGTGFAVISAVAGVLMSAVAMSRLETFPERSAALLRGLTAILCGVIVLGADVWWIQGWYRRAGAAVMRVSQPPIGALMVTALLLMLLIPTFATGEISPYEARRFGARLRWGWSPAGLRRGKLTSGAPYLVLITLLLVTLYAITIGSFGTAGDLLRPAPVTTAAAPVPSALTPGTMSVNGRVVRGGGTVMVNGQMQQYVMVKGQMTLVPVVAVSSTGTMPPGYVQKAGAFPQAVILLVTFTLGFSMLCMLLSVVARNRWVAWVASIVFLMILWMAPEQGRGPTLIGMAPEPTVALYYLNPVQALLQMSDPSYFLVFNKGLPMASQPMWLRSTQAWLVIGVVSLLLSLPLVRRQGRLHAELPYEALTEDA